MIVKVNSCVDCAIPCVGGYCAYAETEIAVCDRCECETDVFYITADSLGRHLCYDCFIRTCPDGENEIENAQTITAESLLTAL